MKTPFRLDEHPRRPQPLAAPPAGYFDQLPTCVMTRVQPGRENPAWSWLTALPLPLRTALASTLVLGGFAASFFLSQPHSSSATHANLAALEQVPDTELVQYLLASEQRVTLTDLADLPASADPIVTDSFLQASPAEVQAALDAQPTEETYL